MRSLLHYQIHKGEENRPWIVFLHGAGGSIATWTRQTEYFSRHFNLLLIDLRDHGHSKHIQPSFGKYNFDIISDDVIRVLDKVGITKAHFITLSFGSVLMQALYRRRPELVDHIIFIGGIFNANFSIKLFVHLARLFNLFLSYPAMYRTFSFLLMPKKSQQFARRVYQQQARKLGAKEYLKWLGLYREFFLLLASFHQQPIENNMLVLMGEDDFLFLPSARTFVASKKHAQLRLVPMAGHICNIDQPHFANRCILNFLRQETSQARKRVSKVPFGTN